MILMPGLDFHHINLSIDIDILPNKEKLRPEGYINFYRSLKPKIFSYKRIAEISK